MPNNPTPTAIDRLNAAIAICQEQRDAVPSVAQAYPIEQQVYSIFTDALAGLQALKAVTQDAQGIYIRPKDK